MHSEGKIDQPKAEHISHSQMLHVYYIYLQNWLIYVVNVGTYSSTMGCIWDFSSKFCRFFPWQNPVIQSLLFSLCRTPSLAGCPSRTGLPMGTVWKHRGANVLSGHVTRGKWSERVTVSFSSGQIFVGLVPNHTFAPKMEEIEHVRIKEFKSRCKDMQRKSWK